MQEKIVKQIGHIKHKANSCSKEEQALEEILEEYDERLLSIYIEKDEDEEIFEEYLFELSDPIEYCKIENIESEIRNKCLDGKIKINLKNYEIIDNDKNDEYSLYYLCQEIKEIKTMIHKDKNGVIHHIKYYNHDNKHLYDTLPVYSSVYTKKEAEIYCKLIDILSAGEDDKQKRDEIMRKFHNFTIEEFIIFYKTNLNKFNTIKYKCKNDFWYTYSLISNNDHESFFLDQVYLSDFIYIALALLVNPDLHNEEAKEVKIAIQIAKILFLLYYFKKNNIQMSEEEKIRQLVRFPFEEKSCKYYEEFHNRLFENMCKRYKIEEKYPLLNQYCNNLSHLDAKIISLSSRGGICSCRECGTINPYCENPPSYLEYCSKCGSELYDKPEPELLLLERIPYNATTYDEFLNKMENFIEML